MEEGNAKEAPLLSAMDVAPKKAPLLSAMDVANSFLPQYYTVMRTSPQEAYNFYKDESTRAHPCADGSVKSATTKKGIAHEISNSIIKEWNPNLSTVHAQEAVMDSVILGITGTLTDNDNVIRYYAQTFFLAPQEGGGFYVHNDFLQFIEVVKNSETSPSTGDTANSLPALLINGTEDSSLKTEQADDLKNKVADSSKGKKSLPVEPKRKNGPSAWQTSPKLLEEEKKVSYASIVAKEGLVAATPQSFSNVIVKGSPNADKNPNLSVNVSKPSAPPVRSSALPSNCPPECTYDVKSIRVKDLPAKMTEESLVELLKKFGSFKQKNIQIKEYSEDGYRYAFVEFDNPKAARLAVEERFIQFEDRELEIQYQRSSNQGGQNNMGRPMPGCGGFRNDNWRRDGEVLSTGSWGHRYNEHDKNGGQFSSQTWDNNFRCNRYFQDQGRNFTR